MTTGRHDEPDERDDFDEADIDHEQGDIDDSIEKQNLEREDRALEEGDYQDSLQREVDARDEDARQEDFECSPQSDPATEPPPLVVPPQPTEAQATWREERDGCLIERGHFFGRAVKWTVHANAERALVLLDDVTVTELGTLAQCLVDRGYSCPDSGRCEGPVRDEHQHDWYIQVVVPPRRVPSERGLSDSVRDVLTTPSADAASVASQNYRYVDLCGRDGDRGHREEYLRREIQHLERDVSVLAERREEAESRLTEALAIAAGVHEDAERIHREAAHALMAMGNRLGFLRAAFDDLDAEWLTRVQDLEQQKELALGLGESAERHAVTASTEARRLRDQVEALREQIRRDDAKSGSVLRSRLAVRAGAILQGLLPSLRFLRDSPTVLLREVANPNSILNLLYQLNANPGSVRGKPFRSAQGWWEKHVSNGEDDQTRLYYRKPSGSAPCSVLISHKRHQSRDADWIRAHGR